jgi:4-hydroxybenzoate polyprenyltransferase
MFTSSKYILISMRPKQWVKNLFVYAGLIFSRNLMDPHLFIKVTLGFGLFSLMASSMYLFNDIRDIGNDRNHRDKQKRPIAAGKLKISTAYTVSAVLAAFSLATAFWLEPKFFVILAIYGVVSVAYSIRLKHMVIVDIMIIGFGFVLRVIAGTVLAEVSPSDWLIICTMTISLFFGFSKRRQELVLAGNNAGGQRLVLESYNLPFLDQMIAVVTACTVISYALYTVSSETVARFGTRNLVFTIPFVLYGIFRYLYLVYRRVSGENPTEMIMKDTPSVVNVVLWFVVVLIVVY